MPAKTWSELFSEVGDDIRKLRFAFFDEHKNATSIEVSPEGIPLRAVYDSIEYGNPRTDIPLMENKPVKKSGNDLPLAKITGDAVFIDGVKIRGIRTAEVKI